MAFYTLKERQSSNEYHLFVCTNRDDKCYPNSNSICNKMHKSESIRNEFICENEDTARIKCAKIGREVCGICVSHLYETYD